MAPDHKTAPFMLHPRLRWLEFRRALLLALVGSTLGGGLLIFGASQLYRGVAVLSLRVRSVSTRTTVESFFQSSRWWISERSAALATVTDGEVVARAQRQRTA